MACLFSCTIELDEEYIRLSKNMCIILTRVGNAPQISCTFCIGCMDVVVEERPICVWLLPGTVHFLA